MTVTVFQPPLSSVSILRVAQYPAAVKPATPPRRMGPKFAHRRWRVNGKRLKKTMLREYWQIKSDSGRLMAILNHLFSLNNQSPSGFCPHHIIKAQCGSGNPLSHFKGTKLYCRTILANSKINFLYQREELRAEVYKRGFPRGGSAGPRAGANCSGGF